MYAPAAGTITERLVQEGEYVREGQPLFRLAGEENIWLEADVYEQDVPYISEGMQAEVELLSFPGETFSGIVTLIWPFLDESTRTLRVRVELESVDARFRAGMYATVNLSAEAVHQAIVVPAESVIRTGMRSVVYVEIEENLFERRAVELGYRSGDLFQLISGVDEGEHVVARGGYLIDSEAQLYSGGQNLHFGHTAEEQGIEAAARLEAYEEVPVGHFYCPVDPAEHRAEPGRCSTNNMPLVERTADSEYDPHASAVSRLSDGAWYCPMGGVDWVADEPGSCPICGMYLWQHDADAPRDTEPAGEEPIASLDVVPTDAWFCPVNPAEHSADPGRCSGNNMPYLQRTADLVFDPAADPISMVSAGQWYCPMGVEWVGDEAGRCPLCGMFLVEMEAESGAQEGH